MNRKEQLKHEHRERELRGHLFSVYGQDFIMPNDEFGLLKNVFGIDDKPNSPTAIEIATKQPPPVIIANEAALRTRLAECTEIVDPQRGINAVDQHQPINPTDYCAWVMKETCDALGIPHALIVSDLGQTARSMPKASLIQLTPDRIINVAEIRRASRYDHGKVYLQLYAQPGDFKGPEILDDPDGKIWKLLELAATHTIISSNPNGLPTTKESCIEP